MRGILFRGKRVNNGEWVYGDLIHRKVWSIEVYVIRCDDSGFGCYREHYVDSPTIGQYTGLTDKNGKRIFEGDIIKTHYANAKRCEFVEVVVFYKGRFCAEGNLCGNGRSWADLWDGVKHLPQDKTVYMDGMEVIGNIHDNPELLKEEPT